MTLPKRYGPATWRGDDLPNVGGEILASDIRRVVLHVMQGTLEGTDAWFHNKDAQVSAHFGIGKKGELYQWVELDREAWAEMAYNGNSWSIEHEGDSGDLLTEMQLTKSLELTRWLCTLIDKERELPAGRAAHVVTSPGAVGVISHGDLGMAGGNHPECPGAPIMHQFDVSLGHVATVDEAPRPAVMSDVEHAIAKPPAKQEGAVATPAKPKEEAVITSSQLKVWLAEAAAVAGWVNTYVNGGHLSATLRAIQAVVSSVILVVSHIFNKSKANKS